MMTHSRYRVAVALTGLLFSPRLETPRCFGAWISEIQPTPRSAFNDTHTATNTIPALIELSGLTGHGDVELVIVDANPSPTRHGRILNTIPLDPVLDIGLITQGPWPDDMWPNGNTGHGLITTPTTESLDLSGARSLLLFDGPTGLVPDSGRIQEYVDLDNPTSASLLDVVTFSRTDAVRALLNEQTLVIPTGNTAIRPMMSQTQPWPELYLIGPTNLDGFLTTHNPVIQLNPARANPVWAPATNPEPSTGLMVLITALGWTCVGERRMQKRSRHWQFQ